MQMTVMSDVSPVEQDWIRIPGWYHNGVHDSTVPPLYNTDFRIHTEDSFIRNDNLVVLQRKLLIWNPVQSAPYQNHLLLNGVIMRGHCKQFQMLRP